MADRNVQYVRAVSTTTHMSLRSTRTQHVRPGSLSLVDSSSIVFFDRSRLRIYRRRRRSAVYVRIAVDAGENESVCVSVCAPYSCRRATGWAMAMNMQTGE